MTKFLLFVRRYVTVLLVLGTLSSYAQSTVSGQVTASDDGTGVPGVNVLEKGTSNGTVTDASGSYKITVGANATLVFSFIGYKTQEVAVGSQTALNISLATDVTSLSEVVVVGYGEVQKKDVTGAVAAISSKDFNKGVLSSPQDLLVGKIAGVQVTTLSGAPGAGSTIRIRGGSSLTASNDPLIVIDGMPVDTPPAPGTGNVGTSNVLSALNPNDIESFTVLKDASATAIYGSRASNGVIIITTKKGATGKTKFTYNAQFSMGVPIKYIDVMDASQFRATATQMSLTGMAGIDSAALTKLGTANTDWQKEIFQNAISHDHNLSASGSISKNLPYRISYGFTDQDGILKTTNMRRNSLNLNLSPTLLDGDLKLNLSAKGSLTGTNFGDAGAVGNAVSFDPTQPVRDGNAEYGGYFSWLSKGVVNGNSNPVAMLEQTQNKGETKRFIGNAQAEYRLPFMKDIKVNLNLGLDRTDNSGYNRAPHDAGFVHSNNVLTGRQNTYSSRYQSELLDFYLAYNKQFGDHKLDATVGYGWQHFYREGTNKDSSEVLSQPAVSFKSENFLVSFFGRLNYAYKGKYLVTATLRDDGTSRVAPAGRWGIFPSISLAWRIKDEGFLAGANVLSDLKLRVGYGETGQQEIPGAYYPYLAVYQTSNTLARYQLGGVPITTLRPAAYDAKLKWETTATKNIGIDFGFLDDKIRGSVEFFEKNTSNLLNYIAIPGGSNFSNFLNTNVGSMRNQGIELTINTTPIAKGDFQWNVGFNLTSINSKITKLNLTNDPNYFVPVGGIGVNAWIQNHQVGYPAFSYFPYQQVYNTAGKPVEGLYVDRVGDGGTVVGNEKNKYHYHRPSPKVLIGLNSRLNYKRFDFSFSSRFSIGNYTYNNVQSGGAFYNNVYQLQHFRNIQTSVANTQFVSQQIYSDYYVQNASFFKLDNISFGYKFDDIFATKVKARLSFTVTNAATITNYKGLDPEVDGGIDNNIYPRPRTFLVGLNVNF